MAAVALNDKELASDYFNEIVEMTAASDVDWPRLVTAREYISNANASEASGR